MIIVICCYNNKLPVAVPEVVKNSTVTSLPSIPLKSLTVSVAVPSSSLTRYDSGSKPIAASGEKQMNDDRASLVLH